MKRYAVTLTAIGFLAAAMAFAQTTPAAQAPARLQLRKEMLQALDLTAAQKQQAKTIRQTARQQAQPLALQLKQDRQSLKAAIEAGNTPQIQQLSAAMGTLRGRILSIRSTGMAEFYTLLTPDQKAKAQTFGKKGE